MKNRLLNTLKRCELQSLLDIAETKPRTRAYQILSLNINLALVYVTYVMLLTQICFTENMKQLQK